MSVVSMRFVIWSTAFCRAASAFFNSAALAARVGSLDTSSAPRGLPISIVNSVGNSVSAKSKPRVQRGPVPIELQKQTLAAWLHSTAMNSARSRRRL